MFRGYTAAVVTDVQFMKNTNNYSDREQVLIINSSNGTSHIFNLSKQSHLNEVPVQRTQGDESLYSSFNKVYNLVAKTRFKYKSIIKQGEMRIVS